MSRKNRRGRQSAHVDKYSNNYNDEEYEYVAPKPSPKPNSPKKKFYRGWSVTPAEVHEVALDIMGTTFYQYGKATKGVA